MGKHADTPSGPIENEIPHPVVDRETQSWRTKIWPDAARLWPDDFVKDREPAVGAPKSVVVVSLIGAALFVLNAVSAIVAASPQVGSDIAGGAVLFGIPVIITLLRTTGRARRAVNLMMVGFSVIAGFSGVLTIIFALATNQLLALPAGLIVTAAVVGLIVVWAKIKPSERIRRKVKLLTIESKATVPAVVLERRTHGKPAGGLVDALNQFGDHNVALGQLGEQITASLLEELLVIPSVHIIHGLKFPQAKKADIDHAAVAGNRIALIDSKLWTSGNYILDRTGRILQDGRMNQRHSSHHPTAVERMAASMPEADVRGWIVIHPQDEKGTTAATEDRDAQTRLVTADGLMSEVGDWLAGTGDTVNLFVVRDLIAQRNW